MVQHRIVLQWGAWADSLREANDLRRLADYLELHQRILSADRGADHNVAWALFALDRDDEMMSRFPQEHWLACRALAKQGKYDRIVHDYPDQAWEASFAAFHAGMWSDMDPEVSGYLMWDVKRKSGRCQEILNDPSAPEAAHDAALYTCGRLQELIARDEQALSLNDHDRDGLHWQQASAIVALGGTEAPARLVDWPLLHALASGEVDGLLKSTTGDILGHAQLIAAIIARTHGDSERFHALLPSKQQPTEWLGGQPAVTLLLVAPLIDGLDTGDFSAFDAACKDLSQEHPYVNGQIPRYFADRIWDRIDDATFIAQPSCSYSKANLPLALALRADRRGDRAGALAAYRTYIGTPRWARGEDLDCGNQRFAEWRIKELEAR